MTNIADDISHAYQDGFNDGYEKGKVDAEFYLLHCGDTDEPQTNADRVRSMTDEELALWLARFTDCGECPINAYPHCTTSEESCACRWIEWLKEEVTE